MTTTSGCLPCELPEQMRHRLEDPRAVLQPARGRARSVRDLGEQPREIAADRQGKMPDEILAQRGAKCLDPGGEGEDVFALAAAAEEDFAAAALSASRQLLDEPALADPRLADHQNQLGLPLAGALPEGRPATRRSASRPTSGVCAIDRKATRAFDLARDRAPVRSRRPPARSWAWRARRRACDRVRGSRLRARRPAPG